MLSRLVFWGTKPRYTYNTLKKCKWFYINLGLITSLLAASGWITKDADQRGHVGRHIEGAFGSRHTTTNHRSQLGSRCWFYGGRKTAEKSSKHGRDQLQQLYSHEFQVFLRINTRLYPGGHPTNYKPVRPGLTWNSVVKGNVLTVSAIRAPGY